jgi:hypothetical protein
MSIRIATIWNQSTKQEREEILKTMGFHISWAVKEYAELMGWIKRDLAKLESKFNEVHT